MHSANWIITYYTIIEQINQNLYGRDAELCKICHLEQIIWEKFISQGSQFFAHCHFCNNLCTIVLTLLCWCDVYWHPRWEKIPLMNPHCTTFLWIFFWCLDGLVHKKGVQKLSKWVSYLWEIFHIVTTPTTTQHNLNTVDGLDTTTHTPHTSPPTPPQKLNGSLHEPD